MTIYDQHMHTLYSFDSEAQLRDYLAQTQAPVVTTEKLFEVFERRLNFR